jgi:uncharacterized Zn-binding protein involved in type VI secretion
MSVAVQRLGDPNSAGGIATGGEPTVRVNQRAVIVVGSPVTPHPPCGRKGGAIHCSAVTTGGSGTVRAGGKPIIRTGQDVDSCGHLRIGGSPDVRIS